ATIDQSSLVSNSTLFVLSGSAENINTVDVWLGDSSAGLMGVDLGRVNVVNGRWTLIINGQNGSMVTIRSGSSSSSPILAIGRLIISPSREASATIDPSSLIVSQDSSGTIHGTLTGTAENVSRVMISIGNYCVDPSICSTPVGSDGHWLFKLDGNYPMGFNPISVSDNTPGHPVAVLTTGMLTVTDNSSQSTTATAAGEWSCPAPDITVPYPLPGYSISLQSPQNIGSGQLFQADQSVTYSSPNLPSWASLSGNRLTFNSIPAPGTYSITIVATNECGSSDTESIPIHVAPAAAIDQSTLTMTQSFSGDLHPLSGTVSNASKLSIEISRTTQTGTAIWDPTVSNGSWLVRISTNWQVGSYSIKVIDKDTGMYYGTVLASGTLQVLAQ
ncbi:MAG: hypothetical protein ACREGH_03575, partial [Minisyncoccia bacterium]